MGNQMVDRTKFHFFDVASKAQALRVDQQKEVESKRETAAAPTDGEMDMTSQLERLGRPIQVAHFMSTLRKLNPNLIFQLAKGDASKYGIYIDDWSMDLKTSRPVKSQQPRFITGMESGLNLGAKRIDEGLMPEFSIIVNSDDIILDSDNRVRKVKKFSREIRGWRTVLAALIIEGLVTEAQVEATFHISQGRGSSNWQKRVNRPVQLA